MNSILVIAGALALMIVVHELGHLVAARLLGISAASFSVGFGRRIFRRKIGLVEYSLRMLPFGGFVHLCGMSEDTSHERKMFEREGRSASEIDTLLNSRGLYVHAPWWKQMIVAVAGCVMNTVVALALFTGLLMWRGSKAPSVPLTASSVLSDVSKSAGLRAGDVIVSCNGMIVERAGELRFAMRFNRDSTELVVMRDSSRIQLHIPQREAEWEGMLGVELKGIGRKFTFASAIPEALDQSFGLVRSTLRILCSSRVVSALQSPVGMAHSLHRSGMDELLPIDAFAEFLRISWALGISLAVGNLLPIPVLDGGHIVFATLKLLRRGREVPGAVKASFSSACMLLLIGLQIYIVVRDGIGLYK